MNRYGYLFIKSNSRLTTNRYFSEVIPTILKYKLISLNNGNLFTKSNEVKEVSKEERDKIVTELKDEFIKRFGGY